MQTRGARPRPREREPEAYAVGLQPSMSRSDILIECAFPFGKDTYEEAGEPARYGSAFHDLIADKGRADLLDEKVTSIPHVVAKKWGFDGDVVDELVSHVGMAYRTWREWLSRNPFKIDFVKESRRIYIESAVALKPLLSGRFIDGHDKDHRYHGLVQGELPGTLDKAFVPKKRSLPILLGDHKTGEDDYSQPETKAQLLSLGAAVLRTTGREEIILAVLHARRRGLPKVYAEKVTLDDLHEHERRLALSLGRIGDGSMKPGPWCKWCPAQEVCPARDSHLLDKAGDVLVGLATAGVLTKKGLAANDLVLAPKSSMTKPAKLGLLYAAAKKAEVLAGRIRVEIKEELLNDRTLLPVTPDDEYLVIREYDKESLSKQSVIDAYGKVAGEKMLTKLRADGAMKTQHVVAMVPEKERGR